MKIVQTALSLVGVLLLGGGYFASQYAYFFGDPSAYANAVSQSTVPYVALVLLIGSIGFLVFYREPEGDT